MLNQELINQKDLKIARLELCIKKFKEYDKERKEYIDSLEHKIQDLEYQYEDLQTEFNELTKSDDGLIKLKGKYHRKLKAHKDEFKKVQEILYLEKHYQELLELKKIVETHKEILNNKKLKKENNELHIRMKSLVSTIKDLVYKVNHNISISEDELLEKLNISKTDE